MNQGYLRAVPGRGNRSDQAGHSASDYTQVELMGLFAHGMAPLCQQG